MLIEVRFVTLSGKFADVKTETFETKAQALAAVKEYAESAGYSNVKIVEDDGDCYSDGCRFTATTPGGRKGRNVAFGDPVY